MLNVPNSQKSHNITADTPLFSVANVAEVKRATNWINERIKQHKSGGMFTETVTITPATAEHILLHHNAGNRPCRASRVSDLARIIREGRWKLTSQGISFSHSGNLNNGQHRLRACVLSGRAIDIRVTWGEDASAFDVLDTGAVRGGADTLHVSGCKNTAVLAAAARLVSFLEGYSSDIKNDEVVQIVMTHPGLEEAATSGSTLASKFKVSSAATTVAVYLILRDSRQAARLPEFLKSLTEGAMLPAWSPILALREGLVNKKFDKNLRSGIWRAHAICACFVKAWNAWVQGGRIKSLRYTDNEKFPEVK